MSIADEVTKVFTDSVPDFDPSLPIRDQINSLELFVLVQKLEQRLGVQIAAIEITPRNFETVESIAHVIARKRGLKP